MSDHRYPPIRRDADGKVICRGCGAPIPPGRQTWCSRECYQLHCPGAAIMLVKKRDKEVCQKCGRDYRAAKKAWRAAEPTKAWDQPGFAETYRAWRHSKPSKPEYHHIKPFSEGGTHALDNLLTLCHGCHAEETRKWVAEKAKARQVARQLEIEIA